MPHWFQRRLHRYRQRRLTSMRRREVLGLEDGVVDAAALSHWERRGLRPVVEPDALSWIDERDVGLRAGAGRFEASVRLSHPDLEDGEFGSLPQEVLDSVAGILAEHTDTPEDARMCVWDGYGYPWGGSPHGLGLVSVYSDDPGPWPWPALPSMVRNGAKAAIDGLTDRDFVVLTGPVAAAARVGWNIRGWNRSLWPDVVYPADRSWLTYHDVDEHTVDVHGTAHLIAALTTLRSLVSQPIS